MARAVAEAEIVCGRDVGHPVRPACTSRAQARASAAGEVQRRTENCLFGDCADGCWRVAVRAGHLQACAVELADEGIGRLRDGTVGALLADDGLLRLLPRARSAGNSRGMEQLSLDGERGRDT